MLQFYVFLNVRTKKKTKQKIRFPAQNSLYNYSGHELDFFFSLTYLSS